MEPNLHFDLWRLNCVQRVRSFIGIFIRTDILRLLFFFSYWLLDICSCSSASWIRLFSFGTHSAWLANGFGFGFLAWLAVRRVSINWLFQWIWTFSSFRKFSTSAWVDFSVDFSHQYRVSSVVSFAVFALSLFCDLYNNGLRSVTEISL